MCPLPFPNPLPKKQFLFPSIEDWHIVDPYTLIIKPLNIMVIG
jgi:hypothetical protein